MPSVTKILFFFWSALLTAVSVSLLGFAMSTTWSKTLMDCEGFGTNNGSAEITMGLFSGTLVRDTCPSFGSVDSFSVFPELSLIEVTPRVLHGLCLGLLGLCLLTSALSILVSLYNSVSNPYETYMGPNGVYACSSISAFSSVLVLIIYVLNHTLTKMQEELVPVIAEIPATSVKLTQRSVEVKLGYFLLIPCAVLSLLAILLIYLYDHAAYTHRREQERPTEDAPKEIMMY